MYIRRLKVLFELTCAEMNRVLASVHCYVVGDRTPEGDRSMMLHDDGFEYSAYPIDSIWHRRADLLPRVSHREVMDRLFVQDKSL